MTDRDPAFTAALAHLNEFPDCVLALPTAPSSTSRRLALSDDVIRTLSDAPHAMSGDFQRYDLTYSLAWQARRHE